MMRSVLAALSLAILWQSSCLADEPLKGHVEHANALQRVNRPAMPSKPMGDAMEHVPSSSGNHPKSGFHLSTTSVANVLDKGAFKFANGSYDSAALKGDTSAADRDTLIAWEHWHERLNANIYHYWQIYGNIPGEGTVVLNITRDGDVDCDLRDFHVNPNEEISKQQKELFAQTISRTMQILAHTDVLLFPERSQRKDVTLTTTFNFSEVDEGPSGYTLSPKQRGDYEKITETR